MLYTKHHQALPAGGDFQVCPRGGRVRQSLFEVAWGQPFSRAGRDDRSPGRASRSDPPSPAAARALGPSGMASARRPGSPTRRSSWRWRRPAIPTSTLALEWSEAVNQTISDIVKDVPPFPFVRESLESMQGKADVMVVSATPSEALEREWEEHGLDRYVGLIAGQERGSKQEHLALAAVGRYEPTRILMVGDALGDWNAAKANGVLFYPIDPGHEEESWQRFFEEALPRFFAGTFAGDYMNAQLARFEALLPERPQWKTGMRPAMRNRWSRYRVQQPEG